MTFKSESPSFVPDLEPHFAPAVVALERAAAVRLLRAPPSLLATSRGSGQRRSSGHRQRALGDVGVDNDVEVDAVVVRHACNIGMPATVPFVVPGAKVALTTFVLKLGFPVGTTVEFKIFTLLLPPTRAAGL
jgi:hypothetical protein